MQINILKNNSNKICHHSSQQAIQCVRICVTACVSLSRKVGVERHGGAAPTPAGVRKAPSEEDSGLRAPAHGRTEGRPRGGGGSALLLRGTPTVPTPPLPRVRQRRE